MNNIYDAVLSFSKLLDIEYEFIFNQIESQKITSEHLEKSIYYQQIQKRICYLSKLEEIFDLNKTIFKYNPNLKMFSVIQAEFLLKNTIEDTNLFTFLSKDNDNKYFCRSFFPDNQNDYSKGQKNWTVLQKKKFIKSTNEEILLFKHKNFQ